MCFARNGTELLVACEVRTGAAAAVICAAGALQFRLTQGPGVSGERASGQSEPVVLAVVVSRL